jgi:DNA-binding NarL/FixJ family response regulator
VVARVVPRDAGRRDPRYDAGTAEDAVVNDAIRVILGDDHLLVREGTRHMLGQYPDLEVVGEAGHGSQVVRLIATLRPDVAVLDMRMPGTSAIEITRELRSSASATRVLVLSAYDDDELVVAALEAGASGYLLKTVRASELVEAVRRVHRGEIVLQPIIARALALLWARRAPERRGPGDESLTSREMQVLRGLAHGLRNREIASGLRVSARTVEGHISTILGKLGVSSRTEAAVYAVTHRLVEVGPRWDESDEPP